MVEDLKEKEALKEKVEKLKLEVEKAKKDIQDIYDSFKNHKFTIDTKISCYCFKIKKEFLNFLKTENLITKKKYNELKKLYLSWKIHGNINKSYYKKEVVDQFKEVLEILNKYQDEYEKQCLTEELCKYTDCLEKLTPTRTCLQCNSEYPKEAKFCPACGCELYKPIIDSKNLTNGNELNITSDIISDIISDQWSYSTTNEPTVPKVEKLQEAEEGTVSICFTCTHFTCKDGCEYGSLSTKGVKTCLFYQEKEKVQEEKPQEPMPSCVRCEFHKTNTNEVPCFYCNNYDLYKPIKSKDEKVEKVPLCPTCDYYNIIEKYCNRLYCKVIIDVKKCQYYKKKILCNSCTYYGECDHPDLTECSQYKAIKKPQEEGRHACAECDHFNNNICEAFNMHAYGDTTGFCLKFKVREKEAKKENTQCPHSAQCGKYDSISSICKKDYYICVFNKNWDLFTKCPYHSTCKDISPIQCYTENYKQCQHYKKNKSFYYDSCTNKFKSPTTCTHDCLNPYCYEPSNKCPYFDKCPNKLNEYEALCNNINIYGKESMTESVCNDYRNFKKEKNRCPYYDQCNSKIKGNTICMNIGTDTTKYGCWKYSEFKENTKNKSCNTCSNINIECGSCINLEKWAPKFVKCLYANDCSSFNSKDNYCIGKTTTHRIGCYTPKETKVSLCYSCMFWTKENPICDITKKKMSNITFCSDYKLNKGGLRSA